MKKISLLMIFMVLMLANSSFAAKKEIPVKGMVTMVDVGSTTCIPCKMMEPVMKNLRHDYMDRAAIIFVNINKDDSAARTFKIRAIPTQIFYDQNGVEKWRHEGFLNQETCVQKIDELLKGN